MGEPISGVAELTHDVPDAPQAWAVVAAGTVAIHWLPVQGPAAILPDGEIEIAGYQVLVEDLDITLPASARKLTLPREFVRGLESGEIEYEVLAIEEGGNQTIIEGTFFWP